MSSINLTDVSLNSFPQQKIANGEPEDHRLYHWAYRRGRENKIQECSEMFSDCSISLIDMALGYYSDYQDQSYGIE